MEYFDFDYTPNEITSDMFLSEVPVSLMKENIIAQFEDPLEFRKKDHITTFISMYRYSKENVDAYEDEELDSIIELRDDFYAFMRRMFKNYLGIGFVDFDDLSEEVMTYITKSLVLSGCRCMYPDRKIISSELENKFFTTLNSDITYRWFTLNPSELQYQKVIQPLCISILDALRANGDKSPKAIDTTLNKMVTRFKIKNERVINLTRDNIVDNLALDIMLDSLEKDIQDIRVDLNL